MPQIHPLVDADDPIVEDLLIGTLELVREAGGWMSPEAQLVARSGQLHVESQRNDGPLFRIPPEAWIRVDEIAWDDASDGLFIRALPDDIGELEQELAYVQAALHNACGKLPWIRATHPVLAPLPDPVIAAVRALVPSFRAVQTSAADVLFATRCFRIARSSDEPAQRMLIPLLDLLNHHPAGAAANWTGDAFTVDSIRPFGTDECALDYGMDRTPIEMAVVYGFTDDSSDAWPEEIAAPDASRVASIHELVEVCERSEQTEVIRSLASAARIEAGMHD